MKSKNESYPSILLIKHHSRRSERVISAVGRYPLYHSTGRNSNQPETFFPFSGLTESRWLGHPVGYFMKPMPQNPNVDIAHPEYPEQIIRYVRRHPNIEDTVLRLGNLEAMVISYLIGGGFWSHPEGLQLGVYLREAFPLYVKTMYQANKQPIHQLRQVDKIPDETFTTYTTTDANCARAINQHLEDRDLIQVENGIPCLHNNYIVDHLEQIQGHTLQPWPQYESLLGHGSKQAEQRLMFRLELQALNPKNRAEIYENQTYLSVVALEDSYSRLLEKKPSEKQCKHYRQVLNKLAPILTMKREDALNTVSSFKERQVKDPEHVTFDTPTKKP